MRSCKSEFLDLAVTVNWMSVAFLCMLRWRVWGNHGASRVFQMLLAFPHIMFLVEVQNLCPSVWCSSKLLLVFQFTKFAVIAETVNAASNPLKLIRFEVEPGRWQSLVSWMYQQRSAFLQVKVSHWITRSYFFFSPHRCLYAQVLWDAPNQNFFCLIF